MSKVIVPWGAGASACLAVLAGSLAWVSLLPGQSAPSDSKVFQNVVQPFLAKNCVACHNGQMLTAGLNLQAFATADAAQRQPEVWAKVLSKVTSGEMPPAGMPAPPKDELKLVTGWITTTFGNATAAASRPPIPSGDAGRVTLRRLNRVEYNNTIRDLLGLNAKAADDFPLDDSGYGFDNNGDVLSLSPLLMEKYIAAAAKLSRLAVYGVDLPKEPGLLARLRAASAPSNGSRPSVLTFTVLPYSMRGVLSATYDFPKDAEYEFQFRPGDARGIDKPYQPPAAPGVSTGAVSTGAAAVASVPRPPALSAPVPSVAVSPGAAQVAQNSPTQAAPGGGRGGGGAAPGRGPRRQLTPEEIKVRNAQLVIDYPPAKWVFELDGKPVLEGSHAGGYNLDQGAVPSAVYRQRLTAGEHSFRVSYPALADINDPRENIIASRKSRALQIGQMDIVGPFNPGSSPAASHTKLFICNTQDSACARQILENLATKAYRREATKEEVDQLAGLVSLVQRQGKPFEEGIRVAVQAVLVSPNFLFRVEMDPKVAPAPPSKAQPPRRAANPGTLIKVSTSTQNEKPGIRAYPVSDYELASRLSYFLWSSMPDDKLLLAAKEKRLRQPEVLEAEVQRMLADPKSQSFVDNFGGQWLGLRDLERHRPDPEKFPVADDDLLAFMKHETSLFIGAILKEDRSILDFIDAPFTYLNGPLARHYGISGVSGFDFQRVDLKGDQRSGILTQASVLTVSSFPTRTSVVTRGKWVLDNLLGTPPPPPPPDVPSLKDTDIGLEVTLRERMQQHRADPACASCHTRMDPIGFSLENYDAIGAWRTVDGKFPIDAAGTLPDGTSFNGAKELKQILKSQSDLFTRNFVEKVLTYALGRGIEPFDGPVVDGIVQRVKSNNYRISTVVQEVVKSKPFEMRDREIQ